MRPIYRIALVVAVVLAFWSTGRADPALAKWGLNKTDCYQLLGSTYCGDNAERIKDNIAAGQR